MKLFRQEYKSLYDIDIYTIECVAHTLNNVVQDILLFILYTDKIDQKLIQSTINDDLFENSDEISRGIKIFSVFWIIIWLYIDIFNRFTFYSKSSQNCYYIQI